MNNGSLPSQQEIDRLTLVRGEDGKLRMPRERRISQKLKPAGLQGLIRLTTKGKTRGEIKHPQFHNLILDTGLNRLGTGGIATHAHVGTGSSTPANGQTALDAFVASASSNGGITTTSSYVAGPPDYVSIIRNFRFEEGTATGNFSEVGIGWSATTGSLFSRALILDALDAPTTITVLADETLDVEYTLRVYPPADDGAGTVTLDGVDYDWISRACGVSSTSGWVDTGILTNSAGAGLLSSSHLAYTGAIGARTATAPSGTASSCTSATNLAYSNNSYTREHTVTWGLTNGNLSPGILSMLTAIGNTNGGWGGYQVQFDPFIPKDATKILTMNFEYSWSRFS